MRTPPGEVLRRPGLAGLALLALLAGSPAAEAARTPRRAGGDYLVLFKKDVSLKAAHRAVRRSGGRIVRENRTVGLALVHARRAAFRGAADRTAAVAGVARNRTIGRARDRRKAGVERTRDARAGAPAPAAHRPARGEPFGPLQWDMQLMGATPQGSYARDQSSHAVRVGIIDTGIDGRHPDIKPNFDRRLSRNFTRDDPVIDGPCARDIDGSCQADPPDVDEDGHGTHVAGTIGAAINGLGMAGVAPKADLVDLRAGQDSGYFFILPTVDALTFAGRHGIDVVNMSFYIDPWLFDCTSNRADSRAEQREQRIIRRAATRALDFAHRHGVTMIAAEGNESTDLGHPRSDATSPDYPDQVASPHHRRIGDRCLSEPSEGPHVINVSSIGRSLRKAVYSNYGVEQTDVAAPGGDSHDFFGTRRHRVPRATEILAPYPRNVARADGDIDARGRIRAGSRPYVLKDTEGGKTAYYQYLEGTSMASPHAVGVAALIIARHGVRDHRHAGLEMRPEQVRRRLEATATPRACPAPEPFTYPGEPASANATCAGTLAFNGFYGHGIVNALRASVR